MALDLITPQEVAAKLGCSRQMVLKYMAAGRIPFVTIAGRRFVERRHARKPKPHKPGPKPRGRS